MDFADAINEHLALRARNARLEGSLPLAGYREEFGPPSRSSAADVAVTAVDPDEETRPGWPVLDGRDRQAAALGDWEERSLLDWDG